MKLTRKLIEKLISEEYGALVSEGLLTEAVKSKILQKIQKLSAMTGEKDVLRILYKHNFKWKVDWQNVPDSAFKKFKSPKSALQYRFKDWGLFWVSTKKKTVDVQDNRSYYGKGELEVDKNQLVSVTIGKKTVNARGWGDALGLTGKGYNYLTSSTKIADASDIVFGINLAEATAQYGTQDVRKKRADARAGATA